MDILQLKYFIAAAENKNFTKAAKLYYISQSNISYHIFEMEKELGTKLFIRNKNNLQLTVAGTVLLEEAYKLVSSLENAMSKTKFAAVNYGKLMIGYLNLATIEGLPDLIRNWRKEKPEVLVDAFQLDVEDINNGILDGTIDVGFTRFISLGNSSDIVSQEIYDEPLCVVVHKDSPLAVKLNVELDNLLRERFLRFKAENVPIDFGKLLGLKQDFPFQEHQIIRTPNIETMFFNIEIGKGVGLMPRSFHVLAPRLKFIPLSDKTNYIHWCAIWKKGNENPFIEPFLDELKSYYHNYSENENFSRS